MKKTICLAFAALLLAVPAANAQKVNEAAFRSKIEKSNADIADAKKNGKASTWINRGKLFYETAAEPTKNLFVNMDAAMLKLNGAVGEPTAVEPAVVSGQACEAWVYPYFTAYVADGKVITWKQTKWIDPEAPVKAVAAYNHAYELDPKSAEKVKAGLKQVSDYCSLLGNVGLNLGTYAEAADAYVMAFDAQSSPAYGTPDPVLLYYAGYLRTVDGPQNPASFVQGADYLGKALDLGYVDEEGAIYYYLFHSLYGQKAENPEAVLRAKDALLTGIEKFPKNERILEGLMQLYTSEQGVGDPSDLISLIDNAIAENPENVDLWFGRGRTFYALKNYDESIASFEKIVELQPELFDGYYYLGIFYTIKGDALNQELNARQYSSQSAYDADLKDVNAVYLAAVPYFEKAHELKPEDVDTLEFLKQLCFRLRDEEGIMEKYNHYNTLYKQAKGLE
ncbi:MAG: tetratricopeptide repeat protein [Alistipes sp.]|nr:tetratricopeptide repeat protein [Alistipes sp.]